MQTKPSVDTAHNKGWQISELVFGIPFLIAIALQFIVPLSLPLGPLRPVALVVGIALTITGLGVIVLARREFARHGEHTDPGYSTHQVMTTGVFSMSRNPLYLGIVIFIVGVAFAADLPWALVMLVPATIACHYILIAPEERYLSAKFGEEYARYMRSVQRWIGRR